MQCCQAQHYTKDHLSIREMCMQTQGVGKDVSCYVNNKPLVISQQRIGISERGICRISLTAPESSCSARDYPEHTKI